MAFNCFHPLGIKTPKSARTRLRKCPNCAFKTSSNLLFLRHLCERQIEFKCEDCLRCLATRRGLQVHRLKMHSAPEQLTWFRCEKCDYKSKEKIQLSIHVNCKHLSAEEKEPLYRKCTYCTYKSMIKSHIEKHTIRKHPDQIPLTWLTCALCTYKTKLKADFDKHTAKNHSAQKPVQVYCMICNVLVAKDRLKEHFLTEHPGEIKEQRENTIEKCEYFGNKPVDRFETILRKHRRVGKWKQCSFCEFKSIYGQAIKRHILLKHTRDEDIAWFRCTFCEYKNETKRFLDLHIRNKHVPKTQQKKYKCELCTAEYLTNCSLQLHVFRKHQSGEDRKVFKCLYCEYSHIQKSAMETHINFQHVQQEVECDFCGVRCRNEYVLRKHIRQRKHHELGNDSQSGNWNKKRLKKA